MPCSESSFVIELKSSLPFAEFVVKKMKIIKVIMVISNEGIRIAKVLNNCTYLILSLMNSQRQLWLNGIYLSVYIYFFCLQLIISQENSEN